VDAFAPATAFEDAAGELVDDLHLALLHDVVLVAVVEHRGLQRDLELVHEVALHFVVEVLDAELLLHLVDARLGGHDDALVFFDVEVDAAHQRAHDGGELVVERRGVGDAARDDERRTRLVDEDRVDLVDDRVVMTALHLVGDSARHVVAQVVEAELVVGAVGDVAAVVDALLGRRRANSGHHEADAQPEPAVNLPHPHRVAAREIVVDRHEVHALARQRVEIDGQRGDERLAFAGAHLGHPSGVQGGAAHQLHVVVALADHAGGCLAHHRERLDEQIVDFFAALETRAELGGLAAQGVVGEGGDGRAEGVDFGHDAGQRLNFLAFAGAQDAVEHAHQRSQPTRARPVLCPWLARARPPHNALRARRPRAVRCVRARAWCPSSSRRRRARCAARARCALARRTAGRAFATRATRRSACCRRSAATCARAAHATRAPAMRR